MLPTVFRLDHHPRGCIKTQGVPVFTWQPNVINVGWSLTLLEHLEQGFYIYCFSQVWVD